MVSTSFNCNRCKYMFNFNYALTLYQALTLVLVRPECCTRKTRVPFCVYYVNHSRALVISTCMSAILQIHVTSRSKLSCEYEPTRTRGRPNECRTSEGKLYEHGTNKQRRQLN